jgi:hypothetical protein
MNHLGRQYWVRTSFSSGKVDPFRREPVLVRCGRTEPPLAASQSGNPKDGRTLAVGRTWIMPQVQYSIRQHGGSFTGEVREGEDVVPSLGFDPGSRRRTGLRITRSRSGIRGDRNPTGRRQSQPVPSGRFWKEAMHMEQYGPPVKNVTASRTCEPVTKIIGVCPSHEVIVTVEQRRVAPCADVSLHPHD